MTQQNEPQFDDPALKAAIRRVSAGEKALVALRDRIAAQMTAADSSAAKARPCGRWLEPQRLKMAIAACVAFLALGWMAYEVKETFFPPTPKAVQYTYGLPTDVAEAMMRVHDTNAGMNAPTSVPASDLAQVKEKLSKDVGIPVAISADLGDGWVMKGSGEAAIGTAKAAYVTYTKSGQTVTVFSIPAETVCQAPQGTAYAQTLNGHGLSGFRDGSGLYCVVSSAATGSPSLEQLTQLRERLRSLLPQRSCGKGGEQVANGAGR